MAFIKWAIKDEYDYGKRNRADLFLIEPPSTTVEWHLNNIFNNDIDIDILSFLRGYCHWEENSDIFYILKNNILEKLQKRQCVMLIDNTLEGHSELEIPIIRALYFNCQKYNVDPDLIFLLHGNLRSEVVNECYFAFNKLPKKINVIGINGCEAQVINVNKNKQFPFSINNIKSAVANSTSDKILLSLSRRNREFRVLTQYLLSQSKYSNFMCISQDRVSMNFLDSRKHIDLDQQINYEFGHQWESTLPLQVDNTDFNYNYAADLNSNLYHQTIFSLCLETHQESYGDTSLFYSEKPFKPILNYQPVLIYGQPGSNYGLREFGYKTYEDYFNLDRFDFEVNPVKRLFLILEEVDNLIETLSKLSRTEQMDWRFKKQELLQFNFGVYFKKEYFISKLTQTLLTAKSIIKNENKYYFRKY